jgi:hypothetical protein
MKPLLNQPIDYSRYPQRSNPSLGLGDFHRSDRRWLVLASSQLALQCFPMLYHVFLQFLYAHPVYAGRPTIGLYLSVGRVEVFPAQHFVHGHFIQPFCTLSRLGRARFSSLGSFKQIHCFTLPSLTCPGSVLLARS